jgi:MscS family membrane protein
VILRLDVAISTKKSQPLVCYTEGVRLRALSLFFVCGLLSAQSPLSAPASSAGGSSATNDPLGRGSPQASIVQFLEACHAHDYSKADRYLDLRSMSPVDRGKSGPQLAKQLEDLLDDTGFDIATLSRDPEGDQTDGLGSAYEHLVTFKVDGQTLDFQMERVQLKNGLHVWLVSAASVALIPNAHKVLAETPLEKKLPQELVTLEIFDTPIWRWIALIVMAAVLWYLASAFAWAAVKALRPLADVPPLFGSIRLFVVATGFSVVLDFAPPSSLPRLFLERTAGLAVSMSVAWACAVVIDIVAKRWHAKLDPRVQAVSYSVLPLGLQVFKLLLYLVALLSVVRAWGYGISTILAGLGVGGIAVALAAQKTIENLFGGVSVIGDRPVLVGDDCRFGGQTGTVIHIGLRSTRLRTGDRTVISVPNAQFSSMALENISARDKIFFHPTLNLRRDTTSEQLTKVLASCREILEKQPKIDLGPIPVRFVGLGTYSLDVEIAAYVKTSSNDEFLAVQQALLLQLLQAVENAGTALAVPWAQTTEVKADHG